MKKYEIFLVDADNTILDFHASSALSLKEAFSVFQKPWKEEYLTEFIRFNDYLWERLERKEITRAQLIRERFPAYLKNLGIFDVDGDEFNQIFLEKLALLPVYIDGATDFLKTLNQNGRVYIVTNGTTKIQRSRFALCGLNDLALDVFVSETIGFNKPAKGYTDYVLSHIPDFQREKAVWIGDSLSADIKAANEANIDSIWYNPAQKEAELGIKPTFTAENYRKILEILQINGN